MAITHNIIITLLIALVAVKSVSVCPSGSISYDTLNLLAEDVLQYRSLNSDVFYRLTYTDGDYLLNCYRVADQSSSPDPVLSIATITTPAQSSWKIQDVSQRGSCVGVQQGDNLVAYNTYSGSFVKVQTIDISTFGSNVEYSVNDNCSMIIVIIVDSLGAYTTKVFQNQVEKDTLALPIGSLFSYDFTYALDVSSNFYKFDSTSYVSTALASLKATPVYVKWSAVLSAVITITKDTDGYSILVIDPTNSANSYSKTLAVGNDYTGELEYLVRSSFGSILLKDDNGFVTFIQLKLVDSLLVATTYTLEQTTYSSLFNAAGFVSVSSDIIFVYNNEKISYFQAYSSKIYYLGQLASDIQTTVETYRNQYSTKEINIVLALAAPTVLTLCTPTESSSSSGDGTATTNTNTVNTETILVATVTDSSTGLVIKCPDNCASCTSAEKCSICRVGYSLNENTNKCVFCNGCLTCNGVTPDVCYLCFAPSVLNRTSSLCVLPSCTTTNCLQCNLAGSCTQCRQGYGLIDSACQQCTVTGCKSCATTLDSCDAASCKLGYAYYLNPSTNKGVCQSCSSGCGVCLTTDLSACSTCSAGYYAAADSSGVNRCSSCFTNCKTCTSATVCTTCATGYALSSDGSSCTLKCNDNCYTCSQSSASTCLTCYAGSVLDETTNKCVVDMACNSTTNCFLCNDAFVLNSGVCSACSYTDPNCLGCSYDSLSVCSKCNTGYYLSNGVCTQCTGNCAACVGASSCYSCNNAYFLVTTDNTETGICLNCDSACSTCSGTSTTCTSCPTNFVLEGSKCISSNRVILTIVIQANVNNFIEFMEDLIEWFITVANAGKSIDSDDVTEQYIAILKTQRYGSSVVTALVSASTPANANSVATAINNAVSAGASVDGYQIISGTATAQTTQTTSDSVSPSTATSSSNIGLILGIVIPLGLILIVVSVVIGYKVHQRKKEMKETAPVENFETDGERYSNKQFTYSNEKSQKF